MGNKVATPQISVLICTYNGETSIGPLLQSVLDQSVPGGVTQEIVLVDNNSRDGTVALTERFALENPGRISVLREPQQGKSYALNRGLQHVRGEICCIIDQDELLPAGYLAIVWNTFQQEPSASFIGGRVLPLPQQRLADWITPDHWSPLAICDYGTEAFTIDSERFVCLLAGAFRTAAMRESGGYSGPLGIRPGRLGSLEDHDLYARLVSKGKTGRYIPEILVYHRLSEERFHRNYHRMWHFGHGKYFSDLRSPAFESSSFSVFGVPGHVLRHAFNDLCKIAVQAVNGSWEQAFIHELRLRFHLGYVLRRWKLQQ
jgi:glycosyltransferase involved in cell wall biosynthesis